MKLPEMLKCAAVCALTLSLATACGEKKCIVTGTVEGLDGIENLVVTIGEKRSEMDTVAVKDGKFVYECALDPTANLRAITYFDGQSREQVKSVQFIPDATRITLNLAEESKVEGSPLSTLFEELIGKLQKAETMEEYNSIAKAAYTENSQNAIGVSMFGNIVYDITLDEFDEFMEIACDKIKDNTNFAKIREAKVNEAKTGPGSEFVDFSGKTPDGKDIKLSDFVGKGNYTLVDFWASWCGPCMRSMPGMVNLWETYHKKGLDILGVAVWDGDNSASRTRIEEKGMVWPQIFVGEDKTPTDIYGIVGIPHVILFDPEGMVIQRGVPDEEQLAGEIADLLN